MKPKHKLLIMLGTAAAGFLLSVFSHLMLVPFLALAAFMGVEWSPKYLAPVLAAAAAGMLLFYEQTAGVFAELAYLLLAPIILTFFGRKKLPHRYAALTLAVVSTVGIYLSLSLDSILRGDPPHADAVAFWNEYVVGSVSSVSSGFSGFSSIVDVFSSFSEAIPDLLMPAALASAEAISLALVLFLRLWYRVFKAEPQPMAHFSEWRLPKSAVPGSIVLGLCIALVYILGLARATAVAISLGIIIVSLFSLQGLSYFIFVFGVTKAPKSVRIVFFLLISLFFPYSLLFLAFFGLREQIRPRRKLMAEYLKEMERKRTSSEREDEFDKYGYVRSDRSEPGDGGKNDNHPEKEDQ